MSTYNNDDGQENEGQEGEVSEPTSEPAEGGEGDEGGKQRGTRRDPQNALDIAVLARGRVATMVKVLARIATDVKMPAGARVQAANSVINLAKFDPRQLKDMTDEDLARLSKAILAGKDKGLQRRAIAEARKAEKAAAALRDAGEDFGEDDANLPPDSPAN